MALLRVWLEGGIVRVSRGSGCPLTATWAGLHHTKAAPHPFPAKVAPSPSLAQSVFTCPLGTSKKPSCRRVTCHVGFAWRRGKLLAQGQGSTLVEHRPPPLRLCFLLLCRGMPCPGVVPCPGCPRGSPQSQWRRSRCCGPVPMGGSDCHFLWTFTKARFKLPWRRSPDDFCAPSPVPPITVCDPQSTQREGCLNLC